ncbi:hypothetical protein [Streptomyces antimycoticus]|uniref:hypothetical protein n=1 Tax=Streptomyces antimycoticus TaxID=68175 RepID=UPI0036E44AA7|nr:hypothetical protein OG751_04150 [Streptomyces antimycoticus]
MFKTAKRRRHEQVMEAARYMVTGLDNYAMRDDSSIQITPKSVAIAALFRHDIEVTATEARQALGAALTESGFSLDRMTTTYDR